MRTLKNISLSKIALILVLNLIVKNNYFLIITLLFLLLDNKKTFLIFCLCIILIVSNSFASNLNFPIIGIVESKYNKYSLVSSLGFKTKIYDEYEIGDVILITSKNKINDEDELIKNIIFESYENKYLFEFFPRKIILKLINNLSDNTQTIVKSIIFNEYQNDIELNFGYGYCIYYLIKLLRDKHKFISNIVLLLYVILFNFPLKFLLLICDIILDLFNLKAKNKLSIIIIIFCILNPYLLFNYAILISILIRLLVLLNICDYKAGISITSSFFFGEFDLLRIIYFNLFLYLRLFIFLISFILLLIPCLENYYLILIQLFNYLFSIINFNITGSISIISFIIFVLFKNKFKIKNKTLQLALISILIIQPFNNFLPHITFIDVGQGDSILIRGLFGSNNVLIDTGSPYNYNKLKTYLNKEGIHKIDYLIITHNDSDHNGNADSLLNDFKIVNVIEEGVDIVTYDINLDYLYVGDFDNDNDNSLVYYLDFYDYTVLLTGDITKNVEKMLCNKYEIKDLDILKVSHHGSKTGTSNKLISSSLPKIAIISTSGAYNHPSEETINTLNSYLVDTYITKDCGSISFYNIIGLKLLINDNMKFVIIN